MKRMHPEKYIRYLLYVCIAIVYGLLNNCTNEMVGSSITQDDIYINLLCGTARSHALSADVNDNWETRIDHVDVLVFKKLDGDEFFSYKAEIAGLVYNDAESLYELGIKLRKSIDQEEYTLVLIANSGELSFGEGASKSQVLSDITFNSDVSEGSYSLSKGNALPMWGETVPATIGDLSSLHTVQLLRAVARVDVKFTPEFPLADEYSIKSVYLCRSRNKGLVVPSPSVVTDPYTADVKVTAPTLPEVLPEVNPSILFDNLSVASVEGLIYLAENIPGTAGNIATATSLILGIRHDDFTNTESGAETHTRYFRADIANKGDTVTQAILRNRLYVIGIREIAGNGSDTPDGADNREGTLQVEVGVGKWEMVGADLVLDGEQLFRISSRKMTLAREAGATGDFIFETNLRPEQLKIEADSTATLDVRLDFDQKLITVTTAKENNTGQIIEHKFNVLAGRMKIPLTVIQEM